MSRDKSYTNNFNPISLAILAQMRYNDMPSEGEKIC